MTAPTTTRKSAHPPTVDILIPKARELADSLGETPSRNKVMKTFRIGPIKATAVLAALTDDTPAPADTNPEPDTDTPPAVEPTSTTLDTTEHTPDPLPVPPPAAPDASPLPAHAAYPGTETTTLPAPSDTADASGEVKKLRRLAMGTRAVFTLGVAASLAGNVLHAEGGYISQIISAWSPLALLLAVELMTRIPVRKGFASFVRLAATAVIAGIAAWISYWHMAGVAAEYGESGSAAFLLPISVDGLIVVASISLVEIGGRIGRLTGSRH